MFKNEYILKVDLKKKQTAVVPVFVQYDSATLLFKIFDNGKSMDLSSFTRAEVSHKRPDGIVVIGSATIEKSSNNEDLIRYTYLGNEMNKTGFVETSLSLFSGSEKVSIQPFRVNIIHDNRDGLTLDETVKEYGLLQELVINIETVTANAITQTVHAKAQGDYAKTEADKLFIVKTSIETAETVRVSAESVRAANETARKSSETSRVSAESARVTKETARVTAETTREANEATRKAQETARQTNTQTAITAANTARDEAAAQANYAKQVADTNKNIPLSPVTSFATIATTYPSPVLGNKVQTIDNGNIYRWNGSIWQHVETMMSYPETRKSVFVSTANQSVFTLTHPYTTNKNKIRVLVGGVEQYSPENFTETTSSSFTLSEQLPAGVNVVAIYSL